MVSPFAVTRVFVGLLQSLAYWALAGRWQKISLLYGGLGLAYWLALLVLGKTPAALLQTMLAAAGIAFAIFFIIWLVALRRHKPVAQN